MWLPNSHEWGLGFLPQENATHSSITYLSVTYGMMQVAPTYIKVLPPNGALVKLWFKKETKKTDDESAFVPHEIEDLLIVNSRFQDIFRP